MIRNWKTTLAGIAALLSGAAKIANDPTSIDGSDIGAIIAGLGLITAKDKNVTGAGDAARTVGR